MVISGRMTLNVQLVGAISLPTPSLIPDPSVARSVWPRIRAAAGRSVALRVVALYVTLAANDLPALTSASEKFDPLIPDTGSLNVTVTGDVAGTKVPVGLCAACEGGVRSAITPHR